tara:strand:+ start:690 stop:1163 length:474 start_codon:yes stop_codon:yes gene_type:complete
VKKIHSKIADPAEVGTWLSGVVALLMHFGGHYELSPEAVGAMMTAALLPLAMAAVRFANRALAPAPGENPPTEEQGFAVIALIPVVGALGILLMMTFSGCGANYHLKSGGWSLEKADCGTKLTVYGDGDPEVSLICIADADPLKVGPKVRAALCEGK